MLAGAVVMSHFERKKLFREKVCSLCLASFKPDSGVQKRCQRCLRKRPLCACGCGKKVKPILGSYGRNSKLHRYIYGHHGHSIRGVKRTAENCRNISLGLKKYARNNRRLVLARARDPERLRKIALSIASKRKGTPTSLEKCMMHLLNGLKLSYRFQVPIEWFVADFVVAKKLIVECDGKYWHSLERVQKRDRKKNILCRKMGLPILRIGEDELLNDVASVGRRICRALSS